MHTMVWLELVLAASALQVALALRPWRAVAPAGPPGPWLAWCLCMPVLWTADQVADVVVLQPLSGACLLMMMAGWPLAMLALLPVALLSMAWGGLDAAQALQRMVWLGVLPATGAMALGALLRQLLPNQLFVYLLGRGFFATALAGSAAGALHSWLRGAPPGTQLEDLMLARFLAAWGDAFLAGMVVAVFVAFRPQWLATYADHIWLLPPRPPRPPSGPR